MYRLRIIGAKSTQFDNYEEVVGCWVFAFDPDISATNPPSYPTGYVTATSDPKEALMFETFLEAAAFWRQQSKTVPLRPDGKPNRPMTSLSIAIELVKDSSSAKHEA